VPAVRNASDLIASYKPDFVVASVNRVATPEIIETCVRHGTPVLVETPPALDLVAMRELWQRLSQPELVQVAEQYPYLPKLQALRALIDAGRLGDVTAAEVSWTHGYHAVAMLRGLLGAEFREAAVTAQAFTAPVTASLTRAGWPDRTTVTSVTRTIALLNFGDLLGVYDFTDDQWFHPLMGRRLTVRGTTGEIIGDRVTTLVDHRTPVAATLQRRQTGVDGDLEGFDLDTISLGFDVLYRNPFQGARLSDEDIAIATVLDRVFRSPIRFLDTASGYSDGESERRIGLAIRDRGGLPSGFVLASKADRDPATGDFSGGQVRRCLERSLTLLGLEAIPLYYLHDPEYVGFETTMAPGGAVEALLALKDEGLVGHGGVAAGPVDLLASYIRTGLFDVVLTHNRHTLVDDSASDLIDLAVQYEMGIVNAAPFGGGILAKGPARQRTYAYRPAPPAILNRIRSMQEICSDGGVKLAAAALQFSTRDPRVHSTVVSFSSPERVRAAIGLATEPIPPEVMQELRTV
jgi:D-threo-aldose 1-dehydrogenase